MNSREEKRRHVHIQTPDGEMKVWLEPEVELDRVYGRVKNSEVKEILEIVRERKDEFVSLWDRHFKGF